MQCECGSIYVGRTVRSFAHRIREHRTSIRAYERRLGLAGAEPRGGPALHLHMARRHPHRYSFTDAEPWRTTHAFTLPHCVVYRASTFTRTESEVLESLAAAWVPAAVSINAGVEALDPWRAIKPLDAGWIALARRHMPNWTLKWVRTAGPVTAVRGPHARQGRAHDLTPGPSAVVMANQSDAVAMVDPVSDVAAQTTQPMRRSFGSTTHAATSPASGYATARQHVAGLPSQDPMMWFRPSTLVGIEHNPGPKKGNWYRRGRSGQRGQPEPADWHGGPRGQMTDRHGEPETGGNVRPMDRRREGGDMQMRSRPAEPRRAGVAGYHDVEYRGPRDDRRPAAMPRDGMPERAWQHDGYAGLERRRSLDDYRTGAQDPAPPRAMDDDPWQPRPQRRPIQPQRPAPPPQRQSGGRIRQRSPSGAEWTPRPPLLPTTAVKGLAASIGGDIMSPAFTVISAVTRHLMEHQNCMSFRVEHGVVTCPPPVSDAADDGPSLPALGASRRHHDPPHTLDGVISSTSRTSDEWPRDARDLEPSDGPDPPPASRVPDRHGRPQLPRDVREPDLPHPHEMGHQKTKPVPPPPASATSTADAEPARKAARHSAPIREAERSVGGAPPVARHGSLKDWITTLHTGGRFAASPSPPATMRALMAATSPPPAAAAAPPAAANPPPASADPANPEPELLAIPPTAAAGPTTLRFQPRTGRRQTSPPVRVSGASGDTELAPTAPPTEPATLASQPPVVGGPAPAASIDDILKRHPALIKSIMQQAAQLDAKPQRAIR